jgi:hypothetical protein
LRETAILKNYNGSTLFRIEHPDTVNAMKNYSGSPICSVNEWDNSGLMTQVFERNLKRKISVVGLDLYRFFIDWKEQ